MCLHVLGRAHASGKKEGGTKETIVSLIDDDDKQQAVIIHSKNRILCSKENRQFSIIFTFDIMGY